MAIPFFPRETTENVAYCDSYRYRRMNDVYQDMTQPYWQGAAVVSTVDCQQQDPGFGPPPDNQKHVF